MRTVIYRITNKVNGKRYIGRTKYSAEIRWKGHLSKGSDCVALKRAIEKYGKDSFIIEEIFSVIDKDSVKYFEGYFINLYSTIGENGYNLRPANEFNVTAKETSDRLSKSIKNSWNDERRKKYSIIIKNQSVELKNKRLTGIRKYIKEKKKSVAGVHCGTGKVIRLSCMSGHPKYIPACIFYAIKNNYKSYDHKWFYDTGESDIFFQQKALESMGGEWEVLQYTAVIAEHIQSGQQFIFANKYECVRRCKNFNLNSITRCLQGLNSIHKGYTFRYITKSIT